MRQRPGCRRLRRTFPPAQRDMYQEEQHRDLDEWADDGRERFSGSMPNTAMQTAIASSKLLLAAVRASAVVRPYDAPARRPIRNETKNMITK